MKFEAPITNIISRTYNVKSFRFSKPTSFIYKAGQFMFITIKNEEQEITKHFTISSSPTEDFLEFTKKITNHEFSNVLDKLKQSDWIRINGPFGNFTFEGEFPKVAMLTGGIGITPLRSMIKYCTDMETKSDIVLLYGNQSEKDIVFREEFENIQKQKTNLKIIFTLSATHKNWKGYSRRIDKEMIKKEIPDFMERIFFICGPPGLVTNMEKILRELSINSKRIKKENFPGY